MNTTHPFYDMFDCCHGEAWLKELLTDAMVPEVTIDRDALRMELTIQFQRPAAPVSITMIEGELARAYGLTSVRVNAKNPAPPPAAPNPVLAPVNGAKKPSKTEKKSIGAAIMGKPPKGIPTPMKEVGLDAGKVHVAGVVFGVNHRFIEKRRSWVLSFNITDNTNSLRVSKFYPEEKEGEKVCATIENGMYLHVRGHMAVDRYEGDIKLEPIDICAGEAPQRHDTAEHKRVELHMHTRFSTMDALTGPADLVKQAARWGHSAVAITDHGVVQAFPEAWSAGEKSGIKVLLGLEGYLVNDIDDKLAVSGPCDRPLDEEFVAFDLETTGLKASTEAITEIGAVLFRGKEIIDTFATFVNPGKPISAEITRLTGIRDKDVADAPAPAEALEKFFAFVGDRPVVAHNAGFDMGFLQAAAGRAKIPCNLVSIDTVPIARALLPELKNHKLNTVADFLGLPAFRHHRALDDAKTLAHMMAHFLPRLSEQGLSNMDDLNAHLSALQVGGSVRQGGYARHIILLVKNQAGLKNLYQLVSASHLDHFFRTPRIPKSLLTRHREGLIVGSACEAGELFSAVLDGKSETELRRIAKFYNYLEIQPLCNNMFLLEKGQVKSVEELKNLNRTIVRLGDALGLPVVATGDVHFLHPEQEEYRRILLAGKGFDDADKPMPFYFKTTDEMLEEFAYLGEDTAYRVVVEAPQEIADRCENVRPLPKDLFTPTIQNSAQELRSLVDARCLELYGEHPPNLVRERINEELDAIIGRDYDVVYMSAQKLVEASLNAGYLVGSRGSVGSSIVAFLSGITEVNSLPPHYRCPQCKHADFETAKDAYFCGADMPDAACPQCGADYEKDGFDIPFATFMGFGGDKIPDIDLNFSNDYQADSHKEATNLFGESHVFRAGTIGTLKEKTAFGFVKNYLQERNRIVTRAEEDRLTHGITGVRRTTGQHPGGLVIIPQDKDVTDFCPVCHPADKKDSGIITTHFDYHAMEDNLLKLDLLGHLDPTMIKYMEDMTGENARTIPLDDPDTMSIFRSPAALGLPEDDPIIGKTGSIAVPEFGTPFTREMLNDTKPENFDTLVRLSGFSHGTDVWLGNAKDLILSGTAKVSEVIGCRDDIMLFLIHQGVEPKMAFDIMENVRKGRGLKPDWVAAMEAAKVPGWYIESCQKIKYLFPKAHAVAYVMMAFRIAWFKVHRPIAFYAAYFTARAKAFDAAYMCRGIDVIRAKIDDIKKNPAPTNVEQEMMVTLEVCYEMHLRGATFAPINLYRSDATWFQIEGDTLIPPFTAVAGLGEEAAYDIVRNRTGKEFISIEEFSAGCPKVSSAHVEQLKLLGVIDHLPDTSQITLF
ncbi:MAG: PolC-type DNA polymerase III [Oscillospiraceae bacterium]|nr:PolC-type DNA polymerase III [Oscillospiraceae bacterium]